MHFFKLLPSIIALVTPAMAKGGFGDLAILYTEQNMQGDSFGIRSSFIDRCITLDAAVYRNVSSIKTLAIPASFAFSALVVRCTLYTTDGCDDSSDVATVTTTEVLDNTDIAAVSCSLNVDDEA